MAPAARRDAHEMLGIPHQLPVSVLPQTKSRPCAAAAVVPRCAWHLSRSPVAGEPHLRGEAAHAPSLTPVPLPAHTPLRQAWFYATGRHRGVGQQRKFEGARTRQRVAVAWCRSTSPPRPPGYRSVEGRVAVSPPAVLVTELEGREGEEAQQRMRMSVV